MDFILGQRNLMLKGLILSKFMPFHLGHIALIDFAKKNSDIVDVLFCCELSEVIDSKTRYNWLKDYYNNDTKINLHLIEYKETDLPSTSVSSIEVSRKWADYLLELGFQPDIIFSSEKYGDYLADFMKCSHKIYDEKRELINISATQIRNHPFKYWEYLPEIVKPFFVFKICIVGTESTGKSTITQRLAEFYQTNFVSEVAREIFGKTDEVVFEDLIKIAEAHSNEIVNKSKNANKLLFIDTDINITKSYSRYLFDKELLVNNEIISINKSDLYLFFASDCQYVQDGTRLIQECRLELEESHKSLLQENNIEFIEIKGNFEEKYNTSLQIINSAIKSKYE